MNLNGFYALCCGQDGYAQIPWECPSGEQISICIQFLPDTLAVWGTLFSLDSILYVKIDNGRIQLTGEGFSYLSDEAILLQRCQNTVVAVYDGVKISIYCNGVSVLQQIIPFRLANISYLRIGENLSAVYIRKAAIFHRQLTEQELRVSPVGKLSEPYRQIDFTLPFIPADVTLHQCCIENYVYTLDCSQGKLVMSHAHLPKEYTLTFSIYVSNHEYGGGTLFNSPRMRIKLCDNYGLGSPRVSIEHDGHTHHTAFAIKTNQWTNLTVVFGKSHIKIYFDGAIQHEISYDPSDEIGDLEFGQFDGYLDSCVIIKRGLSQNEISDYLNQIPDVFDKDILYLFNFSDKLWQESCHGTTLTPFGADIILVKGTEAACREDKSRRAPQSDRIYSDFVNWQIRLLLSLLVNWIHEQLGVYPNKGVHMDCNPWKIDENLHQFVHKEILSMKEAQILLCHYDDLERQELLNLIQAMKQNGTFKKLMDYLYQDDDKQGPVSEILMALLAVAGFLAALLAALGKAITNMGPIPNPPDPPQNDFDNDDDENDDDKKKKKTYASIKQTSLKGDLRIEFDQEDIMKDSEKIAVFFVHSNSLNTHIETSLSYRGDDGEFTVFAENRKGKIISSAQENVSFYGNNSVKITLDIQTQKFEKKYGKCTETVRWRCESSDGEQSQFLGETSYELYFLENTPCKLWGDTVHIECLKLCADCAEYVGEKSEGFVKDYAQFIRYENILNESNADSMSAIGASSHTCRKSYSQIPTSGNKKFVFDAVNFARDYRRGRRNISYNDIVYSNAVFSYLNGHQDTKVLCLSANMSYWSYNGQYVSTRLLLNSTAHSADFYCLNDSIHYVVMDDNNKIHDPKLDSYGFPFSDDNERKVTGANNSGYYRESRYLEGSYCEIIYSIDSKHWTLGNLSADAHSILDSCEINDLPENSLVGWVRPRADGGYENYGRTNEDPFVWNYIRNRNRRDGFDTVCHSISAHNIEVIIARICTKQRLDNSAFMQSLVDALYPTVPGEAFDAFVSMYHRLTKRVMITLSRALSVGNELTNDLITHFCRLAVNSPANLRLGKGDWNSVIGVNFDPKSWFYYCDPNAECVISERAIDEACEGEPLIEILLRRYAGIPNLHDNIHGLYLPDRADGIRIRKLREAGHPVNIICRCVRDEGPVFYPLIYSSSNWFRYREDGDNYINLLADIFPGIHIYYLDIDNRWAML